jgi:hypothetical protein
MNKQLTTTDTAFAELRNLSEYAGALKAGLALKKMMLEAKDLKPDFKISMINAIDDAIKSLSPDDNPEMSDVTVGDVIDKIENSEAI